MGSYSLILREIKTTARGFDEALFLHENRVSNKEPHDLAKFVLGTAGGRQVWFGDPPNGVCIPKHLVMI